MLKALTRYIRKLRHRKFYRLLEQHEQELFQECMTICTFSKLLAINTQVGQYLFARYLGKPTDCWRIERLLKPVVQVPTVHERRNCLLALMIRIDDIPPVEEMLHDDPRAVREFFAWLGWDSSADLNSNIFPHPASNHTHFPQ